MITSEETGHLDDSTPIGFINLVSNDCLRLVKNIFKSLLGQNVTFDKIHLNKVEK